MQIEAVDVELVRPLRALILRPGQAPEELRYEHDDDPDTRHWALISEGLVLGVASVMRDPHPREERAGDWRIRGMATREEVRGRGLGGALLSGCVSHARERGGRRVWCNARLAAVGFYERAGFAIEGDVFEIADIGPHHVMSKPLARD
jgi:GNAT superfamily N-acetyltransferase